MAKLGANRRAELLALFRPVEGELEVGRLVRLDGDGGRLEAVLGMPSFDRVFTGGNLVELEGSVGSGRLEEGVVGDDEESGHPRMNVALELQGCGLGGD